MAIYGATSAGVIAAIQAVRMGKRTVLIEPSTHVGGLSSSGLGMTDSGDRAVIGGLSREFYQRIRHHYEKDSSWKFQKRSEFPHFRAGEDALWRFEPGVAEGVFNDWLETSNVEILLSERLDRREGIGVQKSGASILSIVMESGCRVTARRFIDATYEGDLMAAAGVSYRVGRESNREYGETLNGIQQENAVHHQFRSDVDPYVTPGMPQSGLLKGVAASRLTPEDEGAADHKVQAYCFRMCLTDVPENRAPFAKPVDYDASQYELLLRYLMAGTDGRYIHPAAVPNRKTDTNNNGAFSTDFIGRNYDYPDGDYLTRERIVSDHRSYQEGLMWFLCNDERVPQAVREQMGRWGLAKDEFVENGHWPYQIYVREARRMVSDYVQTEHDCLRTRQTPEPVGMGSYNMDSHHVQRYIDPAGYVRNEGDVQVSPSGPYQISFRAIRPRQAECDNLVVPVALSASHIAYGSIRMEPVFMILGQSGATAACLSIDADCSVQSVDYATLRDRLQADGQVLSRP